MRWALAVLGIAVLSASASAATPSARVLVLAPSEVPQYYEYDDNNSVVLPRPPRTSTDATSRKLLDLGLEGGRIVRYLDRRAYRYVYSTAFVFTRAAGARRYFGDMTRAARVGTRPSRVELGDEAILVALSDPDAGTAIVWRHGRVVASVTCAEMNRHRALALALARTQERRIARILR